MNALYCEEHFGERLSRLRSAFHRHPELGMEETWTSALIRKELEDLGAEILDCGLQTGVLALIQGNLPGPTVALRADIDALPVQEDTQAADASEIPGKMHACGHDIHITSLLGAAMLLQEQRDTLKGNVLLIFQPAEEPVLGAAKVIETGIFEKQKDGALFCLHVWPYLELGQVGVAEGPVLSAKDSFRITVFGKGGHGSAPQETRDPVLAAAAVVMALQSIVSRNVAPSETAVVSVCQIEGGNCDNVIPETCSLLGSIRTFSENCRQLVLERIRLVAENTASAYGCQARFERLPGVPAQINAPELGAAARMSAQKALGKNSICELGPEMISEDFACYPQPSYFYRLGVHRPGKEVYGLHHPRFYPDSRAAVFGAALLAESAITAANEIVK